MVYRIKALILFIMGVIIAVSGIVIFLMYPDLFQENTRSYSFAIMLVGLIFVAVGSVWGKKRMARGEGKKDFFSETIKKFDDKDKGKKKGKDKKEKPEDKLEGKPEDEKGFFSRLGGSEQKIEKKEISSHAMNKMLGGVESNVIRIYICPGCGSENPEGHKFCSECGKKLKFTRAQKKDDKKPAGKGKK